MVATEVESRCNCGFTVAHIEEASFQCFTGSDSAVTYRASLRRTPTYSRSQLIDMIAQWIAEDGVDRVQQVLISVDKSCQVAIDGFDDPECNNVASEGGMAVIGGVVGGVVIVLIIAVTIIILVIAVFLFKRRKNELTEGKMTR